MVLCEWKSEVDPRSGRMCTIPMQQGHLQCSGWPKPEELNWHCLPSNSRFYQEVPVPVLRPVLCQVSCSRGWKRVPRAASRDYHDADDSRRHANTMSRPRTSISHLEPTWAPLKSKCHVLRRKQKDQQLRRAMRSTLVSYGLSADGCSYF
jgi:hypothetical protein